MKVSRSYPILPLTQRKTMMLLDIMERCATVRTLAWQKYGSVFHPKLNHRTDRDHWVKTERDFRLPARLWKATWQDAISNINAYYAAQNKKIVSHLHRIKHENLVEALYQGDLTHPILHRVHRQYYGRPHNHTHNQIILDSDCYTHFVHNGRGYLKVMSLEKGKRLVLPLKTPFPISGTIRLIYRHGQFDVVHFTDIQPKSLQVGQGRVGIDKGYTECFTDNHGKHYGLDFGKQMQAFSDWQEKKQAGRNRLYAKAKANPKIYQHNLGKQKLKRQQQRFKAKLDQTMVKAIKQLLLNANEVVAEDLSFQGRSTGNKHWNRRLNQWHKGRLQQLLELNTQRYGVSLILVNAAYTSQGDSRHANALLGRREGNHFYCFDGVVLDADQNAACNILHRATDSEIGQWDSRDKVRALLLSRAEKCRCSTVAPRLEQDGQQSIPSRANE